MRRLAPLLLAAGLLVLPTAPAHAAFYNGKPHWNCPNGISLYSGGHPMHKKAMRQAVYRWNDIMRNHAHPDVYRNTRIAKMYDWDWNALAWGWNAGPPPGPCIIDVDSYNVDDGTAGFAPSASARAGGYSDSKNHFLSGAVMLNARYDQGEYTNYVVAMHELAHTMGLGHNGRCDSVMGPCNRDWISSDDWNSLGALYIHAH